MVVDKKPVNPLIESIHERRIDRPDSWRSRGYGGGASSYYKRDWHPIAAAVAAMAVLLQQKNHRWNKGEKLLYKRALAAARHPCCPTCGKPMSESAVTHEGQVRKSWFCATDQNL